MLHNMRMCPGCKTSFQNQPELAEMYAPGSRSNRYGVASPECAAVFFNLIAFEAEHQYLYPHRLVIDSYAVQHPRNAEIQQQYGIQERLVRASIQSIAIHLIALYLSIEKKVELQLIPPIMAKILKEGGLELEKEELIQPQHLGTMMAPELMQATSLEEYTQSAWAWAHVAWNAWAVHHVTVKKWYEQYR